MLLILPFKGILNRNSKRSHLLGSVNMQSIEIPIPMQKLLDCLKIKTLTSIFLLF